MRELFHTGNKDRDGVNPDVRLFSIFNYEYPETKFFKKDLRALGRIMTRIRRSNVSTSSGYTYLGQFLAHDLSRLRDEKHALEVAPIECDRVISTVSPSLDLSCIYDPPEDGVVKKDQLRISGSAKMLLGAAQKKDTLLHEHDLPRTDDGMAIIADDRNDENVIVSQLHLQFLKLHNFFVEKISKKEPNLKTDALFEAAKEQVILHYQEVILYDLLYEIMHPDVWRSIILEDRSVLWKVKLTESGEAAEESVLPIEYAGAAGRFGHPMVNNEYALNDEKPVFLEDLFKMTGAGGFGNAEKRLPASHVIDWLCFFDFPTLERSTNSKNKAERISPAVRIKLKHTRILDRPKMTNLARRNLVRGAQLKLPSGQFAARHLNEHFSEQLKECGITIRELSSEELSLKSDIPLSDSLEEHCPRLLANTPLWYYVLVEACLETHQGIGKLGPLGSLFLAESIKGVIKLNKPSIFQPKKRWNFIAGSKIVPQVNIGRFLQMSDLILAVNPGLPNPLEFIRDQ
tara:strand:+ start:254 stop:1798 length:1545 start_codon:yes stop_codon:yes gene_type:complete